MSKSLSNSPDLDVNNLNVLGTIRSVSTQQAADAQGTTGSISTLGGVSIKKDLWVGGTIHGAIVGDATTLDGKTWESPGAIGSVTPNSGSFTTISATGSISSGTLTSTVGTGVAPLSINSLTVVPNLNSNYLQGSTWATAPAITTSQVFTSTNTTEASAGGAGSIVTAGGVFIAKDLRVAGTIYSSGASLDAATLQGYTWASPGALGTGTRNTAAFTTLTANGVVTLNAGIAATTVNSGTLRVTGGVGVNGRIFVPETVLGGGVYVNELPNGLDYDSTVNGPFLHGLARGYMGTSDGAGTKSFTVKWTDSQFLVQSSTEATDASGITGCFGTQGGASIAKRLYVGSEDNASGYTSAGVVISGGVGIAKDVCLQTGAYLYLSGTTNGAQYNTTIQGPFVFGNGGGYLGIMNSGTRATSITSEWNPTQFRVLQTTASSSSTTGALTVAGGLGIAGSAFIGGTLSGANVRATSGTAAISTTTGALVVTGGIGVSGDVYIGGSILTSGGGLNANTLQGATWASPLAIGTGTPNIAVFSSVSGPLTGTVGAGTRNSGAFTTVTSDTASFTAGVPSSSFNTGTVVVTGGLGVSGKLYTGDDIMSEGVVKSTATFNAGGYDGNSGAIQTRGGMSIAKVCQLDQH